MRSLYVQIEKSEEVPFEFVGKMFGNHMNYYQCLLCVTHNYVRAGLQHQFHKEYTHHGGSKCPSCSYTSFNPRSEKDHTCEQPQQIFVMQGNLAVELLIENLETTSHEEDLAVDRRYWKWCSQICNAIYIWNWFLVEHLTM